jgi:hypothetical protein
MKHKWVLALLLLSLCYAIAQDERPQRGAGRVKEGLRLRLRDDLVEDEDDGGDAIRIIPAPDLSGGPPVVLEDSAEEVQEVIPEDSEDSTEPPRELTPEEVEGTYCLI